MTAKIVIASADRLIDVRHFCRKRRRIAEINVPAWPMPIQKTKFVMSNAQPTELLRPQMPIPFANRYVTIPSRFSRAATEIPKQMYQPRPGFASMGREMSVVILWSDGDPSIHL